MLAHTYIHTFFICLTPLYIYKMLFPLNPCSFSGAKFSKRLTEKQLKLSLGVFMLCVAPTPFLRDWLKDRAATAGRSETTPRTGQEKTNILPAGPNLWVDNIARSVMIGLFSGFQAGLFGVGGGAVVVPALCMLTDLSYKESLGTSMAIMFPTALFGSLQHFRQGTMVVHCAVPLAAGCLVGSFIGGGLVLNQKDDAVLKGGFSSLMVALGLRVFMSR